MQDLKTCLQDHGYLVDVSRMPFDWDGSFPVIFKFYAVPHEYAFIKLYMVFGCCFGPRPNDSPPDSLQPFPHWAFILFDEKDSLDSATMPLHVCSEDHVTAWPGRSRTFSYTDTDWNVQIKLTLSFIEDQHSPASTLVPHVKHEIY